MLLIEKKNNNSGPKVINIEGDLVLRDLFSMLNSPGRLTLNIYQVKTDGLFALCKCRNIDEVLKPFDRINCALEVSNEPFPHSIKIVVSGIMFFRLAENDYYFGNGAIGVNKEMLKAAICSVSREDAQYVGAMFSVPRQDFMIRTTIDVCSKADLHEPRIVPKPGIPVELMEEGAACEQEQKENQ